MDNGNNDIFDNLSSSQGGNTERVRLRVLGISYSQMMHGLKVAGVDINRKMLAEMAVNDAEGFATLAELAKSKVA